MRKHGSGSEPVRKIQKTGNYTYYVSLPREALEELGWRSKQKVVVERSGKELVIRDWKEGGENG